MKLIDVLLIIPIALIVFFAVRRTLRTRKSGGCGCGCAHCNAKCDRKSALTLGPRGR